MPSILKLNDSRNNINRENHSKSIRILKLTIHTFVYQNPPLLTLLM